VSFAGPGPYGHVRGRVSAWASAADSVGVAGVQLLVDGRPVAVDRAAPYLLSWNSGAADRTARLTLRAYDRAGNASDVHRWVVADNTAPLVRITRGPGDGRRVAGTVRLGVAAADVRGVSRLDLLVNGELVGSHAGGSHTFAVPTDRFGRTLRVQVRAVDAAGNVRYAAARTWRS
jgi:hypothetical protein